MKTIPHIGSIGNTRQLIAAGPQDLGKRYLYNYSVSDLTVGERIYRLIDSNMYLKSHLLGTEETFIGSLFLPENANFLQLSNDCLAYLHIPHLFSWFLYPLWASPSSAAWWPQMGMTLWISSRCQSSWYNQSLAGIGKFP